MSNAIIQLITGRVVSGNPSMLIGATDMKTKEPVIGDDGKQKQVYWTTIAVDKNSPELESFFQTVLAAAKRPWPTILNEDNKLFAWKIMDGDGLRRDNKPYVDYCRGCWLITVRSGWVPTLVEPDGRGGWMSITDPNRLKVGYHVKIGLKVIHNGDNVNPGLYLNPDYIALVQLDTVLSPGQISIEEVSKGLGQSGTAIQHPMYSAPPAPTTHAPAPGAPTTHAPAPGAPTTHAPAPGAPTTHAPAPPVQFTMTELASGLTREQYHAAGWSDKQLIDARYMNAPPHNGILG